MELDIAQLEFIHQKQRDLLLWVEKSTGYKFKITSLYRMNDPGIHGTLPLRATDLRTRSYEIGKAVETMINEAWEYDPDRPEMVCAYLHGKGMTLHLHTQTHQNTRLRE